MKRNSLPQQKHETGRLVFVLWGMSRTLNAGYDTMAYPEVEQAQGAPGGRLSRIAFVVASGI